MSFDDVSQESRQFLNELRLYLFVNGKNEEEADEIVEELYVHLKEAEKNGKSVEHVVGKSPREYMETLGGVMNLDIRSWGKYIVAIVLGFFSIVILQDALEGAMAYSLIEIVGNFAVLAISVIAIITVFKYVAGRTLPRNKERMLFATVALLPILLFVALILINRQIESPIYIVNQTATWVLGCAALVCLIAISVWAKSLILIGFVALLTIPDYLLSLTNLDEQTQLLLSTVVLFGGILLLVFFVGKKRDE